MRRLIVAAFLSLDGVMQAPGGPEEDRSGGFPHGGWLVPFSDDSVGAAVGDLFDGSRELVLGRRTYDIFAGHWPRLAGDPFADGLNAMVKHVATRSADPLGWRNCRTLGPDAAAAMRALKETPGPDLFTQGSGELVRVFLREGLVDELRLITFPVLIGTGKTLFGEGSAPLALRPVRCRFTESGVSIATFERAGPLETGSFALDA